MILIIKMTHLQEAFGDYKELYDKKMYVAEKPRKDPQQTTLKTEEGIQRRNLF